MGRPFGWIGWTDPQKTVKWRLCMCPAVEEKMRIELSLEWKFVCFQGRDLPSCCRQSRVEAFNGILFFPLADLKKCRWNVFSSREGLRVIDILSSTRALLGSLFASALKSMFEEWSAAFKQDKPNKGWNVQHERSPWPGPGKCRITDAVLLGPVLCLVLVRVLEACDLFSARLEVNRTWFGRSSVFHEVDLWKEIDLLIL